MSDVTFAVPERSIVSIIGPNGAGKTTFFNMLTGFYKPTLGRIVFDSRNVTGGRPDVIMKLGMARTFQNIRLFATMTASRERDGRPELAHEGGAVRLDLPHARRAQGGGARRGEGARRARLRGRAPSAITTGSRSTSRTATSGGSRSHARWPRTRRCCCSTSRRPGMNPQESDELTTVHAQGARRARHHDRADRARHEGRHGRLRAHHGARPRREDRRGQARRGADQPARHRGLPGQGRVEGGEG